MKQMTFLAYHNVSEVRERPADIASHLIFNVPDQGLELLFELATNTGASHDGSQIYRKHALVL